MKCPNCKTSNLARTQFAGVPVKICRTCNGYLVQSKRVGRIKSSPRTPAQDGNEDSGEFVNPYSLDTLHELTCPSCTRGMSKEVVPLGQQRFFIDNCNRCEHVWFDANELDKLQIRFQETQRRKEAEKDQIYLIQISEFVPGADGEDYEKLVLTIHFPCPKCRKRLSTHTSEIGHPFSCHQCAHPFFVPELPPGKRPK